MRVRKAVIPVAGFGTRFLPASRSVPKVLFPVYDTPAVHYAFPEMPVAGLGEILEGDAKLDEALVQVPETRLSVLTVKGLPDHPSELLGSRAMMDLIAIQQPAEILLPLGLLFRSLYLGQATRHTI